MVIFFSFDDDREIGGGIDGFVGGFCGLLGWSFSADFVELFGRAFLGSWQIL